MRGIRPLRLTWRGLEPGLRRTYSGTKVETEDTAKGSLRGTAPVLDPTIAPVDTNLYLSCGAEPLPVSMPERDRRVGGLRFIIERAPTDAGLIGADCRCQIARSGR